MAGDVRTPFHQQSPYVKTSHAGLPETAVSDSETPFKNTGAVANYGVSRTCNTALAILAVLQWTSTVSAVRRA